MYLRSAVYFVQAEDGGPVKIGWAHAYAVRRLLSTLQVGNPARLVIRRLVAGGAELEKLIHGHLARYRVRETGKWFYDAPEVSRLATPRADPAPVVSLKTGHGWLMRRGGNGGTATEIRV